MFRAVAASLLLAFTASTGRAEAPASHRISQGQARQMALLVARHDRVDLNDSHVEFNSMDMGAAFIPGYASFIVIRESSTPGPDETLHRYAVNRRSGDVWEMTQCTRYSFPALTRMQRALAGHASLPRQIAAERHQLGCSSHQHGASM